MRMLESCTCRFAMIFEDEDVLEAAVLLEIDDTIAERPEHVFNALLRHVGKSLCMVRCLDDYLMSADAIHAVIHSIRATIEVPFDSKRRIFVWNHTHRPAGLIPFPLPMAKS